MAVIDTYTGDSSLSPDDKVLGSSYESTINGEDKYITKNYKLGDLAAFFSGFINEGGATLNVTELITKIENSFGVVGDGDYSQALYERILEVIAGEGYARVTDLESLTAVVQTNDTFARSNITRIDEVIATETFTRAQAITNLSSQFTTDLTNAVATINQTLTTYADADMALAQSITNLNSSFTTDLSDAVANINQTLTTLATADQALAQSITTLDSSFTTDLTAAVAGINQTLTTLATADQALAQSITTLDSSFTTDLTTAVAGINQTLTTLTTADQALSQSITTLNSSFEGLNTSVGSITQTLTSLSTDSLNLQSDVSVLRSAFLYGAGGSIQDFDNVLRTKIQDLITAQTGLLPQDADLADVYTSLNNFSTALGFLSSGFVLDAEGRPINIANATLEENLTAIAQAGVTLGTLGIDLLPEQVGALRAAFDINAQGEIIGLGTTLADSVAVDVQTTLTGAGYAYALDVDQLKTSLGLFDENGNITALSSGLSSQVTNIVTTASGTIVSDVNAIRAGFVSFDPTTGAPTGFSDALKTDIGTVIATADLASSSSVEELSTRLDTADAQISGISTNITNLTSSVNSATGDIASNAAAITALGTRVTTAEADVSAIESNITNLSSTVNSNTGNISTNASNISQLGARITTAETEVGALQTSITNLEASIDANTGSISAQANSISTLSANIGSNTASISSAQSAIVTLENGIDAKLQASYGLFVNAGNNKIAGLKLLADSTTISNFIAQADLFAVDMPNGTRVLTVDSNGLNINGSGTFSGTLNAGDVKIESNDIEVLGDVAGIFYRHSTNGSLNGHVLGSDDGSIKLEGTNGVTIRAGLNVGNFGTETVSLFGDLTVSRSISALGNIIAYASSDKRLKENITPIENAINKINSIGGYEFDWNDKQADFEGHDIGVIAQEIQAIAPELVTKRPDGYLAVKYEKIVALLIQGMKEQQIQIDELKNKLDGITK